MMNLSLEYHKGYSTYSAAFGKYVKVFVDERVKYSSVEREFCDVFIVLVVKSKILNLGEGSYPHAK